MEADEEEDEGGDRGVKDKQNVQEEEEKEDTGEFFLFLLVFILNVPVATIYIHINLKTLWKAQKHYQN